MAGPARRVFPPGGGGQKASACSEKGRAGTAEEAADRTHAASAGGSNAPRKGQDRDGLAQRAEQQELASLHVAEIRQHQLRSVLRELVDAITFPRDAADRENPVVRGEALPRP